MLDWSLSLLLHSSLLAAGDGPAPVGPPGLRVRHLAGWSSPGALQVRHVVGWSDTAMALRLRHVAAWTNGLRVRHGIAWRLPLSQRSTLRWADKAMLSGRLNCAWSDRLPLALRHASRWDGRLPLAGRTLVSWGDQAALRRRHALVWHGLAPVAQRHAAGWAERLRLRQRSPARWALTVPSVARHACVASLLVGNPLRARLPLHYAILSSQAVRVQGMPELTCAGRRVSFSSVDLSCDEDSPYWIARITIDRLEDYLGCALRDVIELRFETESYVLVVDGQSLSRPALGETTLEWSAVSPLALLDAPYAAVGSFAFAEGTRARAQIEHLIGPTDWQLPDWIVPAGRAQFAAVTPLAAARRLVEAVGGLIESAPDGSAVCRRRHPVSPLDYATTAPTVRFAAADIFALSARIAPQDGFNRVTVANEEVPGSAAAGDALEYAEDDQPGSDAPGTGFMGTVRAWPDPVRPVTLAHTGRTETRIEALGRLAHTETETVEFIDGKASVRYPVDAIVSITWNVVALGAVTASGRELVASVPAYSLAEVTYLSTSQDWRVGLDADAAVQFVLLDL